MMRWTLPIILAKRRSMLMLLNMVFKRMRPWTARQQGYGRQERRARRRLQEIVDQTRNSFPCELYRKNRAAQLKRRAQ